MQNVQGPGVEHNVHDGDVDEDSAKGGLEEQTEVHEAVGQALVEEGELAGLGDEKIGPLHHNDGDEVGGLGIRKSVGLVVLVREELLPAAPPVVGTLLGARVTLIGCLIAALQVLQSVFGDIGGAIQVAVRYKLSRLALEEDAGRHILLSGSQLLEPFASALAGVVLAVATETLGHPAFSFVVVDNTELNEGVNRVNGRVEGDLAATVLAVLVVVALVLEVVAVDGTFEVVGLVTTVTAVIGLPVTENSAHEGVLLELKSDAHKGPGSVAVVVEHNHVGEETRQGLHHTDLQVGKGDEATVHKTVGGSVTGSAVHDVGLLLLVSKRNGGNHVGAEIDHEDHHGGQGQGELDGDEDEERTNLGDVGGKGVADGLLQVIEDQAAFLHTVHDGGEVVVHEDHVSGLLGDILTSDTHGNTDISLLEGGGVVHAVASHGDNLATALVVLDDLQLVRGRHAGEHNLLMAEGGVPLGLTGHGVGDRLPLADVVSLDHDGVTSLHHMLVNNADRLCDGLRSDGVITSDHEHFDARTLALLDGLRHTLARGVDQSEQTNEDQVVAGEVGGLLCVREVLVKRGGQLRVGEAKHALSETAKLLVGSDELILQLLRQFQLLAVEHDVLAVVNDTLGGSLQDNNQGVCLVGLLVDRQLPLVGGVELDLEDLGVPGAVHSNVFQALHALGDANLGRISGAAEAEHVELGILHALDHSENGAILGLGQELGVVAQSSNHLQLRESGVSRVVVCLASGDRSGHEFLPMLVVLAGRGAEDLVVIPAVLHGHAVLGQGAGLVGSDDCGGTKGLHGLQVLHKYVLLVHTLGGKGKRHGHSGKQTFGHVGHNDTDHEHDVLDDTGSKHHADGEEGDTENDSNDGDQVDELGNLDGDRGVLGGGLGRETGDLSHSGVVGSSHNDTNTLAGCDDRGEEAKVLRLESSADSLGAHGSAILGLGLASQGRVVNLELTGLDEADIRGNLVTVVEGNEIAGDELACVYDDHLAGTGNVALLGDELRETLHDSLGLSLLEERESGGDHDDQEEHNSQVQVGRVLL
mmetsp:Transcript_29783/g.50025  ORF Transcript_29783/g.50025 Transcript_29783/m.50025 type:complete len:1038 (-) Transcript_29783:437-3550(-)